MAKQVKSLMKGGTPKDRRLSSTPRSTSEMGSGLTVSIRTFVCEPCANIECRDFNAAHNILEAGRRLRSEDTRTTSQEAIVVITAESHAL